MQFIGGAFRFGARAPEEVSDGNPFPVKIAAGNAVTAARAGQISVSSSVVTLILPANPKRTGAIITMVTGTQDVFVGPGDRAVSLTTGHLLTGTKGTSLSVTFRGPVFGLASTSAQTVSFWEEEEQ